MTYSYNLPGYGYYSTDDPAQFMEQLAQLNWTQIILPALGIFLCALALTVLFLVAWGRMFHKAKLPWERLFVPYFGQFWQYRFAGSTWIFWANIIVPILSLIGIALTAAYGSITMFQEIVPMIFGLMFIVLFVLHCIYCVKLSKAFGHGFFFGMGLLLLNYIFILILGYGGSEYVGEYK